MGFTRRKHEKGGEDSMRKIVVILMALCVAVSMASAQSQKLVREGNKLYEQNKFKEAGATYQKALQKDPTSIPGMFNLGNSLYQQKQFDASRKILAGAAKNAKDKGSKAEVNYNIGNTYMSEKKWEDAIESYKQTLKNNPQDADAKYNLSYAKAMMKKDQGGGGKDKNKDKDKDKKDDKNKDKNKDDKGDKDKDKQDKGEPDKDKKDQQDKDQQRPQPQPSKLSQQQADQLLNALQQEEKKLQDKMQKEKGVPVKTDKDW
jgi:Ca-activated chloride channel family protein